MRVIDYTADPATLSRLRFAGADIEPVLALRRVPAVSMVGKGAVMRGGQWPGFLSLFPLPAFQQNAITFPELMRATAAALLAEGKEIHFAWSGGLDSTGALLALKDVGATKAQVAVHYTDASVEEYPALVPFVEQNFVAVKEAAVSPHTHDCLWVNGEGGNQLFFPVRREKFDAMRADQSNEAPWESYFFRSPGIAEADKQAVRYLMALCPFPVSTVEQAQWWRVFYLHWQHLALRQGRTLAQAEFNEFRQSARPFFMTEAWQVWSMAYMATKQPDDSYLMLKRPLKDYIQSVYPDDEYYNGKATQPSSTGVNLPAVPYIRFEDGSVATTDAETMEKVQA